MFLRNHAKKQETETWKEILTEAGLYEDGMKPAEMRNFLTALNLSEMNYPSEPQQSLSESLTSLGPNRHGLLSSTVVEQTPSQRVRPILSPFSSPEPDVPSEVTLVTAEVHHEADWNPEPNDDEDLLSSSLERRAESSENDSNDSRPTPLEEQEERTPGSAPQIIGEQLAIGDSGCSSDWSDFSSFMSASEHSSHFDSSETHEADSDSGETNRESVNCDFNDENATSPWYLDSDDCRAISIYIRNSENYLPVSSSSENIDFDRESQYST